MKNLILSVITTVLSTCSLMAGHNETSRSNCPWYAARFKASTHLGTSQGFGLTISKSCHQADDYRSLQGASFNCVATSESHSGLNTGQWGQTKTCPGIWGGISSPLFNLLNIKVGGANDKSEINYGKYSLEFIENTIKINSLDILLTSSNNSAAKVNVYEISIWKPNDDVKAGIEDTILTDAKKIIYGRVELTNGQITVTGTLFKQSDFIVTKVGSETTVTFKGNLYTVLPNNVKIDQVIVTSIGDIIPKNKNIFDQAITSSNNNSINLVLFPIPSNSNLQFTFTGNDNIISDAKLFDSNGFEVPVTINIPSKQIDITTFQNGTYYIYFELVNGEQILKSFYKN